jgi:hypothetical protein
MTLRDWFPVITLVLGSILTIIGGLISERSRAKASATQAIWDREIQDNLARTAFQRDNILQLQDAGQVLIKLTLECFHEKWADDPQPIADPGQRQARPVSEKAGLERRMARIEINKLTSRLQDQQARTRVYELLNLSHQVIDCDDFEIAQAKLDNMLNMLSEANEKILGPILRSTFPVREGR